jgi:hypothetical protein
LCFFEHRKTGWASNAPSSADAVTSEEFPQDYAERIQKVNAILMQINGTGLVTVPLSMDSAAAAASASVPGYDYSTMSSTAVVVNQMQSVAEAALNAALGVQGPAMTAAAFANPLAATATGLATPFMTTAAAALPVAPSKPPSRHILVRNMFDKDEETDDLWWEDINEDVKEECTKFGKVTNVVVMHLLPGGIVYVSFDTVDLAQTAAKALEGRWFAQRQLHVEFVEQADIPAN